MKEKGMLFVSAVLAGVMISIGGAVLISSENIVAGAAFFTVGLFSVCAYGLGLYTGRIGYLIGHPQKAAYLGDLGIIWLGNAAGCLVMGFAIRAARPGVLERVAGMVETRLTQTPVQTVLLGAFCGLLMYIAVDHFKKSAGAGRYLGVLLCVPAFILGGFEHCVADMFYMAAGGTPARLGAMVGFLLLATLGNSLGSFLIPLAGRANVTGTGS